MSEVKLAAEKRSEFGKGAARKLRRAAKVPAVLYGHGTDPVHLSLPAHDTMMALKHTNALLSIDMGSSTELALAKDVQRHPVRHEIEHVDLLIVKRGEKVIVEIPVHVVGAAISGSLVATELNTLTLEVEATHIPSSVEVDVQGLEIGAQITAGEVVLPQGAALVNEPDALVVHITQPQVEAVVAEDSAGEDAGEGAVGAKDAS